ncbi:MFS transporter [Streptomyces sp. H10-C2]|uniref:MFS transporter n=1 Tax=unclassified Streptomyces TaxID=2593676 RepID=UPI0024BAFF28|nr:MULTISPECIES: MFS transporter [unclassified Streptomyces]MDJ0346501.1 MFS transporter [Streptomyces sp. PH10-H1]MDJ0374965.1 MFS transporter [Streptomyces sp. H10-C2]
MWPLYAAGFSTAFGAHGIAANLGSFTSGHHQSLLVLGGLLALYDGAEVLLKPVFGALADRVGARPVLLGGLVAFALARDTGLLWVARLGQGAAASAFSPAASVLVARLNPQARRGRAFGSYGFYKSLGYTAGPLLGGVLVWAGGLTLLFTVTAALAGAVAIWMLLAAVLIGAGTGLITPLAFTALADAADPERLGQTMGAAELGRELGDAGGPLLVAGIAAVTTLTVGFGALALVIAAVPLALHRRNSAAPDLRP